MAADIFAKIGDIKGESLDSKHKDRRWRSSPGPGESRGRPVPTSGSGASSARRRSTTSSYHHIDKASPLLLRACATESTSRRRRSRCAKRAAGATGIPDREDERRPSSAM